MLEARGRVVLLGLLAGACVPRPDPLTTQPLIGISTEKVSFRHSIGIGHGAPEQRVTVRNQGGGVLMTPTITVRYLEQVGEWLQWELAGGANAYELWFRVENPAAGPLPPGGYHATVEVDCASAGAAVLEIDEQVVPKVIAASPDPLQVTAALGGKGWIERVHVEEQLHGDLPEPVYAISIPSGLQWLSVGTPFQSWSDEEQTEYWDPDLQLSAAGLAKGQYDATLTATSADVGSVSVPVHLVVDDWGQVPNPSSLECSLPLDLANGRVLCATDPPRVFDPATGAWTALPPSPSSLPARLTTLLPNGTVLVLSQANLCTSACVEQAEWSLLDPGAGAWVRQGALPNAQGATATPLADGRVLLTGHILAAPGEYNVSRASALLDPVSGTVTESTTSMIAVHQHGSAVRLSDGRVLVVGGVSGNTYEARAEIFTPSAGGSIGTWTSTGAMTTPRAGFTLVRLPGGQVLAAGGYNGWSAALSNAEIYDPSAGRWTAVGSMSTGRSSAGNAVTLPDGTILVTGGQDILGNLTSRAERYDPATRRWTPWADLPDGRGLHAAEVLNGSWVLVFGGYSDALGSVRRVSYP